MNVSGFFKPDKSKKKCFLFVSALATLVFLLIMTGASMEIRFLGWVLMWPGLLFVYRTSQLTAENFLLVLLQFAFIVIPYLYFLACVLIYAKREIEK